jgi:polyisoprenoid-binding protein YceI
MRAVFTLPGIAACLLNAPAHAQRLPLDPPATTISYTAYALGVLPIHATFKRFSGAVTVTHTTPLGCTIDVSVDVASLHMEDPDRQREVLGADMLDANRFPKMRFVGACTPGGISGTLTLHGVSRAMTLLLRQAHAQIICTGSLRRTDFGVNGLAGIVSPRVWLRLVSPAPAGVHLAQQ